MKHKLNLIKSAKARVTGTIPYCHGKVPHSRKLFRLCSNDFKGVLFFENQWIGDEKLFQGNSDIMIDFCTHTYIYIYIYIQVSVRDITQLHMVSLLSTKFHEILFSSFRGVVLTSCFRNIFQEIF
jgi:hypothetical protein